MHLPKSILILLILGLTFGSCSKDNYKFELQTSQKVVLGDNASISFKQVKGNPIDSIHLFIANKRVNFNGKSKTVSTNDLGVGKHIVTAIAFYPNGAKKKNNYIEVFANKKYQGYTYKIVNSYPHDKKAYTQGLEYYNGFLYETTGRKGKSWLRKVELTTGKVLQQKDLSDKYFGEGMTIFNNQIFWLTWQAGKGFIYNLDDFKELNQFNYNNSYEGWGLTHNDTELVKSDGTNKIWFLNPENQEEKRAIQAYTHKQAVDNLNELEWVNGKIYANYWRKPLIAIINPTNGIVEGIVNLTPLQKKVQKEEGLDVDDEVLNGIAYDKKNNRLFVTGKHWSKLYEIELVKQ